MLSRSNSVGQAFAEWLVLAAMMGHVISLGCMI